MNPAELSQLRTRCIDASEIAILSRRQDVADIFSDTEAAAAVWPVTVSSITPIGGPTSEDVLPRDLRSEDV